MNLKNIPDEEKPRERLLKYGAKNISNEDLLSIILGSGIKNVSVKTLSNLILEKLNGIESLKDIELEELTAIKGIGKVKAITILAAIELGKRVSNVSISHGILINNTKTCNEYFSKLIIGNQEKLLVILLDNKKRLLNYRIMFIGTDTETLASTKEIFNYAIRTRASGIIIMHNHPSGIVSPSQADRDLTKKIIETGKIIGIPLLDHIITSENNYYSFFDEMIANEI